MDPIKKYLKENEIKKIPPEVKHPLLDADPDDIFEAEVKRSKKLPDEIMKFMRS